MLSNKELNKYQHKCQELGSLNTEGTLYLDISYTSAIIYSLIVQRFVGFFCVCFSIKK